MNFNKLSTRRVRRMWRVAGLLCLALSALPARAADFLSDIDYRLGEGLRIPGTGLSLGGYATGLYARPGGGQPARAALQNVSLSLWWEGEGRWKVFAEFDSENTLGSRAADIADGKRYVALERMYVDYALDESTTVRAGKFLTPIGRWNLIHAAPLVWTTSRPMITTQAFPTNATGAMVNGRLPTAGHDIEYSVYLSGGSELRVNPAVDPFSKALGVHVNVPMMSGTQVGLSYVAFGQRKSAGEHKQLVGLDALWTHDRYEISGEGIYSFSGKGSAWDEHGAFVQAVVPLSARLYGVARYESFLKAQQPRAAQQLVVGLNWRVTQAIVLKAEWIGARHDSAGPPRGFASSLSVLF